MYRKVGVLILAAFAIGSAALALRQQQLSYAHQITRIHHDMDQTRRSIWMMQSLVAQQLQPGRLRHDVETRLAVVEPLAPTRGPSAVSQLAARPATGGDDQ